MASTRRSPTSTITPREQVGLLGDLQLDGPADQVLDRSGQSLGGRLVDRTGGANAGDAPSPLLGDAVDQPVERPDQVSGAPADDRVGGEADRDGAWRGR